MTLKIATGVDIRRFNLPAEGRLLAGRDKECDIVLDDRSVSRRHAWLETSGGRLTVKDNNSKAGTVVNGWRIDQPTELRDGDELLLGLSQIFVLADEDEIREDVGAVRQTSPAPAVRHEPPSPPGGFSGKYSGHASLYADAALALQSRIHEIVLSRVNAGGNADMINADSELAARAENILDDVLRERRHEIPEEIPPEDFRRMLLDELLGYGPISRMIEDPEVTEIMVNGPDRIFVESKGLLYETDARFMDERHLVQIIKRIVESVGRHVDDASPMVDARLPDGSRVNAIIPPLSLDGASLTIRKFPEKKLTDEDLIRFGSISQEMAMFLREAVRERKNILVSGGTGSGKTTLLNILSQFIPEGDRLVTIEDSAELRLFHRNIVRLEARPANIEGKGRVAIRDLVVNALRMRPDRIIVGECRGAEALDMLQAMNTGHDGSLTTAHANSPRDALARLENMVMMAGFDLPSSAIREQIASAIDLVVQEARFRDGTRKVVKIVEVTGREGDVIQMQDIFVWNQTGYGEDGKVQGFYTATGNIPYFIEDLRKQGSLKLGMDVFVPKV